MREVVSRTPYLVGLEFNPDNRHTNLNELAMIRSLAFIAIAWSAISGCNAFGQTSSKLPTRAFFGSSQLGTISLSPSGKYLAITATGSSGHYELGIAETANLGALKIVQRFKDISIYAPRWINDERLYFALGDPGDLLGRHNGMHTVINRDGSGALQLNESVWRLLDDGSDDVIVSKATRNNTDGAVNSVELFRMDTHTMRRTALLDDLQPRNVTNWVFDKDNQPRYAYATEDDATIVHYRKPGQSKWAEVSRFKFYDPKAFSPAFIDGTGQTYVTMNDPEGFAALYRFDPDARQVASEPTFEVKGFDIRAAPVFESTTRRLLGFQYESDAPGTYWFDEKMLAIQAIVDKKLPATINALNCAGKDENRVCVVRSGSDQQPSKFYLFQPERNEWTVIGETRPWINPRKMARVDFHRFQARDGLSIPVYVTTPTDGASGPRPAVVLIHGGPNVRGGHWVWNPQAQFLASRGYLVIEADYRGSTGYGFKHFQAGWKQWGLAMQDDIADATNWAIAKGFADKNRIAIGGASYGGYATLMGLIKNPELFRCGFEWAGVTDIDLRFSVTWSDASDRILRYDLRTLMGDPEKDAAQFQATSPLRLHKHLTQPLLLGYGTSDRRVPLVHGTKLRDEVMKHNDHVEWVAYDLEGHGWALTKNNIDWWTRVEKFLERNMQR